MIQLDTSFALAKNLTATFGIRSDELTHERTNAKKVVESWLQERENSTIHDWAREPYRRGYAQAMNQHADFLKKTGIDTVLWIGIGGSSLGPKVLHEVFSTLQNLELCIIDSIDPSLLEQTLALIEPKKTAIVVVSKSGATLETMATFFTLYDRLKKSIGKKIQSQTIAICDPSLHPLSEFCTKENITIIPMNEHIGGRYSIVSPVGILPLALLGANVSLFLKGMKDMDTLCQSTILEENPALMLAVLSILFERRGQKSMVIMPYGEQLASFSRWATQLIAESLGKQELHIPMPFASFGTQDQHSLLQSWMEGPRSQWHIFIGSHERNSFKVPKDVPTAFSHIAGCSFSSMLQACMQGTSEALKDAKRPSVTITLEKIDEYHIGQLFYVFMTTTVFMGKLLRVNPYGQPGVEAGKKRTKELLSLRKEEE